MIRKLLTAIALLVLLPLATASLVSIPGAYAAEPPPAGPPGAAEPDDPEGQPYPPDGVTDPNATYPTDGAGDTTDPGEAVAVPPEPPAVGEAPAPGKAPPD